jgi:hypothetical protein
MQPVTSKQPITPILQCKIDDPLLFLSTEQPYASSTAPLSLPLLINFPFFPNIFRRNMEANEKLVEIPPPSLSPNLNSELHLDLAHVLLDGWASSVVSSSSPN